MSQTLWVHSIVKSTTICKCIECHSYASSCYAGQSPERVHLGQRHYCKAMTARLLRNFAGLTVLRLSRMKFSVADFQSLAQLKNLQCLQLHSVVCWKDSMLHRVSAGEKHGILSDLTQITRLDIHTVDCWICSAAVPHFTLTTCKDLLPSETCASCLSMSALYAILLSMILFVSCHI